MTKVLLVDDEQLALEYLENIISWELYDFEVVGAVTDAGQALKLYRKTNPDLVISDVNMYGMDGIHLASAIREIDPNTHILFLSGYKNFEYLQEAIRLGIDDYLLKSDIDEEVFLKKILKIKDKIEKEQYKKQYTENMIFRDLFEKNTEERAYREMLSENEFVRLHKKYYYMIISVRKAPRFLEEYIPGINQNWYIEETICQKIVTDTAQEHDIREVTSFLLNDSNMLSIFEMKNSIVSQKEIAEKLYQMVYSVFQKMNMSKGCQYNVFYCKNKYGVRQFGSIYRRSSNQMNRCYIKSQPHIIEYETEPDIFEENMSGNIYNADQIYQDIVNRRIVQVEEYPEIMKIMIEEEDFLSYLWCLKEMLKAIDRYEAGKKHYGRQELFVSDQQDTYDLRNADDTIKYLRMKLDCCVKNETDTSENTYSKAILRAMDYVKDNYYKEELTSVIVAKEVGLSTSWLSTKFKEEVGVGFVDYLNGVRIQEAKNLFEADDYMIYEVSEKVGFSSSQYFSKIFKQNTGVTPNEYKRLVHKGRDI